MNSIIKYFRGLGVLLVSLIVIILMIPLIILYFIFETIVFSLIGLVITVSIVLLAPLILGEEVNKTNNSNNNFSIDKLNNRK